MYDNGNGQAFMHVTGSNGCGGGAGDGRGNELGNGQGNGQGNGSPNGPTGGGLGHGNGRRDGSGGAVGRRLEVPAATRLLRPDSEMEFYICQLHTIKTN